MDHAEVARARAGRDAERTKAAWSLTLP